MTMQATERPLGALFRPPDPREFKYRYRLETAPDFSKPANLQSYAPPIWDQGHTGSCVAQSVCRALMVAAKADENVPDPPMLSREAVYAWARLFDGDFPLDNGTYATSALDQILAKGGVPKESLMPFDGDVTNRPSAAAEADAKNQPYLGSHAPLYHTDAGGLRQGCVAALQAKRPVVLGLTWYAQFDNTGPDGVLSWPITSRARGGHEITLLDFEPARPGVPELYWCDNSWTASFGKGGRVGILPAMLESRVFMDARVIVPAAVSPQPQPDPNPADAFWAYFGAEAGYVAQTRDLVGLAQLRDVLDAWMPWLQGQGVITTNVIAHLVGEARRRGLLP